RAAGCRAPPARAPSTCDRAGARSGARAPRRPRLCPAGAARNTWRRPCRSLLTPRAGIAAPPRCRPQAATRTGLAARARANGAALISFVALRDALGEVRHFHGDLGAVPAFLRSARLRLFLGVGGENAVCDRDAAVELYLHEARSGFVRNEIGRASCRERVWMLVVGV